MNDISYTLLRKRISLHVQILSAIMITGILLHAYEGNTAHQSVSKSLLRMVFPMRLWRLTLIQWPIDTGLISVVLSPVCIGLLFYWGWAYRNRISMGPRIQYWLTGFMVVLTFTWINVWSHYIWLLFSPKQEKVVSPAPVVSTQSDTGFDPAKVLMEHVLEKSPLGETTEQILFFLVLVLYTAETVWLFSQVWKAEMFRKTDTNAGGSSLS